LEKKEERKGKPRWRYRFQEGGKTGETEIKEKKFEGKKQARRRGRGGREQTQTGGKTGV